MRIYQDFLINILNKGVLKENRTGIDTLSLFGYQMRFDLNEGFPLVTTKKVHLKSIIHELIWFLQGDTNIAYLKENGVSIWDEWADADGNLGPVYGKQWRFWEGPDGKTVDQIKNVIEDLKTNPNSRRIIVSAWNPIDVPDMAIPPCPCFFQFYVANGKLSCQLYQRSADAFLGLPFDIACYALLTMMVAQVCKLKLGDLIWLGGDCHIYTNHIDQVHFQLGREPRQIPWIRLNPEVDNIFDFKYEDFTLVDYYPYPPIKAPVAI